MRHLRALAVRHGHITHRGKASHCGLSAEVLSSLDIHDGTIRVSVGIEDAEDIVGDFIQALGRRKAMRALV